MPIRVRAALLLLLVTASAAAIPVFLSPAQQSFMVRARSFRDTAHVEAPGANHGLEIPSVAVQFEVGFHVPRLAPSFKPGGEVSLHLRFADRSIEKHILALSRYALYNVHALRDGAMVQTRGGVFFQEQVFLRLLPHQHFIDWLRNGTLRDDQTPHAVFRYETMSASGKATVLMVGIPYGTRDDAPPFAFLANLQGKQAVSSSATQLNLLEVRGIAPDWLVSNEALLYDSLQSGIFKLADGEATVATDSRLATLEPPSTLWKMRAEERRAETGGSSPQVDLANVTQQLIVHFDGPTTGDLMAAEVAQLRAMAPHFLAATAGSMECFRRALAMPNAQRIAAKYTSQGMSSSAAELLLFLGSVAAEQPTPVAPLTLDFTGDVAVFDVPRHPRPLAPDLWGMEVFYDAGTPPPPADFASLEELIDSELPGQGLINPPPRILPFETPRAVLTTTRVEPPTQPRQNQVATPQFVPFPPPAVIAPMPSTPLLNGAERKILEGSRETSQATGNDWEASRCAAMLARDDKRREDAAKRANEDALAAWRRSLR